VHVVVQRHGGEMISGLQQRLQVDIEAHLGQQGAQLLRRIGALLSLQCAYQCARSPALLIEESLGSKSKRLKGGFSGLG